MKCPGPTLRAIAERSRTLYERLGDAPRGAAAPGSSAAALLQNWQRAFAPKDGPAFERRLAWDELDRAKLAAALGPPDPDSPLPVWTSVLADALDESESVIATLAGSCANDTSAGSGLPFAEVLLPFLHAGRKLAGSSARQSMSAEAWQTLEHELLKQLSSVASMALYQKFDASRNNLAARKSPEGDAIYRGFVLEMLEGGWCEFLLDFSVLARQIGTLVLTWVRTVTEFSERFEADRPLIAAHFGRGADPGSIAALRPGLSDRHDHGRQVIDATLTSGLRLIYKPRDIGLTEKYETFLKWIAENGLAGSPSSLKVLRRDGYGWIEYADHLPVTNAAEAAEYFRKAGSLLALAYLLEGRDLHMDNVVCAGTRGPILIDVEALFQPSTDEQLQGTFQKARGTLQRSVINSGLLSFQQTDADGRVFDMGGFCGRGGHLSTRENRVWKSTGTDAMKPVLEPLIAEPMENVVRLNGRILSPSDFQSQIAEGFEKTYRFLIDHRDELQGSDSPLQAFRDEKTRLIFRPSNLYALVQSKLISPEYQRDGIEGTLLIDSLNRLFAGSPSRPALWPLVAEERAALERLDIPLFTMGIGATSVVSEKGETVSDFFRKSGLSVVTDRLRSLSPEDLQVQTDLLRAALADQIELMSFGDETAVVDTPPLSREELLQHAFRIADTIDERAIRGDDGGATWIAPAYLRLDSRTDQGVSHYLYGGAAGISLFLAALAAVGKRRKDRDLALAAVRPIEMVLKSAEPSRLLEQEGIGICNGLGSLVYSLTIIAALLDEDRLVESARALARQITEEKIGKDTRLDLEGGSAGAILALLELFETTGDRVALSRAVACGEHLMGRQLSLAAGGSWSGDDGPPLAGLAHGAAGFAWALARLSAVTGKDRYLAAARKAVDYERSLYSPREGNWKVLVSGGAHRFMTAWCHGAPGIALGRLGSLSSMNGSQAMEEIDQALKTTSNSAFSPVDHLCCGNLGRADVLLTAGRRLGRPALIFEAEKRVAGVVRRAAERGSFSLRVSEEENRTFQPGFFRGVSGVGYQLLRLVEPSLPSILSFEGASRPRQEA